VVGQLGESSVDLFVRPWVNHGEYLDLRFALIKAVKQAFDKEGITVPYPQRVVHTTVSAAD
jgi:small conductance mechanosensitive channel